MRTPTSHVATLLVAAVAACTSARARPQPTPPATPATATPAPGGPGAARLLAFISDLHLGLGRNEDGSWNPVEDFRWTRALKGYLRELTSRSAGHATLVIAGDMFEFWQHPDLPCTSPDLDYGCSVSELESLATTIVAKHREDLAELGAFAADADNRLVLVPGNHDAALLLPSVRLLVTAAIGAPAERVTFAESGVWASPDGTVVAEHGHQMPGEGINGWKKWPQITASVAGTVRLRRPWGEAFVHELYDSVEIADPVIDNVIPQSSGAKHYLKQKGFLGSSADVARFLAFNITHASLSQLGALKALPPSGAVEWDVPGARQKGWRLYADASPDEWTRQQLGNPANADWTAVRDALDSAARDAEQLPDEEVRSLCDAAAMRTKTLACPPVDKTLLIGAVAGMIPGANERALRKHLGTRATDYPRMQVLVYGHTHVVQCPARVTPPGRAPVWVANTGAFQRLIDDGRFVKEATRRGVNPAQLLGAMSLDELPACYPTVLVTYRKGRPRAEVLGWSMGESDENGRLVPVTDCRCAQLAIKCGETPDCETP